MHAIASTENARSCQEMAITVRAGVKIRRKNARRCQAICAQVSRKSVGCADFIGVSASPITIGTTDISYQTEDMKNIAAARLCFAFGNEVMEAEL